MGEGTVKCSGFVHPNPPHFVLYSVVYDIYHEMFRRGRREGSWVFRIRAGGGPFRLPGVFQRAGGEGGRNPNPNPNLFAVRVLSNPERVCPLSLP